MDKVCESDLEIFGSDNTLKLGGNEFCLTVIAWYFVYLYSTSNYSCDVIFSSKHK